MIHVIVQLTALAMSSIAFVIEFLVSGPPNFPQKSTGYFMVIAGLVNVTLAVILIIPPLTVWIVWLCATFVWIVIFSIYETVH